MKDAVAIALFVLAVGAAALAFESGVALNFIMMALYATLLAQAWNMLGGFGGQFSFGHALFFGSGAYVQAMAQLQGGINAWVALGLAIGAAALVGAFVGALAFRYGLKGSYFALITLAFAEVFRILALSVPFTGAGVGLMLPLRRAASNLQFDSPRGYALLLLGVVASGAGRHRLAAPFALRRAAAGGARQRGRGPRAGHRPAAHQALPACCRRASLRAAGGAFYVQMFQYIDPAIAFGPTTSVEALLGAIVGGMGTLWGPVLGALALHVLSDVTRNLFGALPGINMVIYGVVLVVIVMFMPRGIAGIGRSVRSLWQGGRRG